MADIAKINLDEAAEIRKLFDLPADDVETLAGRLRERFGIDQLLLTAGAAEAYYASDDVFGYCPA
jgi:hypothetical protein